MSTNDTNSVSEQQILPMPDAEKIRQAFLQLSFAAKLHVYAENSFIDKKTFDCHVKFLKDNINLPANEFYSYDEINAASINTLTITLGFTTSVLYDALRRYAASLSNIEEELYNLLYMIRCCFMHNSIDPRWFITKQKYLHLYEIQLATTKIVIDLTTKNDKPFKIDEIGGYAAYFEIRDAVIAIIERRQSKPNNP